MSYLKVEIWEMSQKNVEKERKKNIANHPVHKRITAAMARKVFQLSKQSPHGTPKGKKDGEESGKDKGRRDLDGE